LPPGLGNQNSNNPLGLRGPFSHSSSAGRQWSALHSSLPYGAISPLSLGTQILPALHSHQQHQYSHPQRKPYPLANPPARPPASFQKGLPLPLAPKPAGASRGAPLTAPLVAPARPCHPHPPAVAPPATSNTGSSAATPRQDGAGTHLQVLDRGAGQALRAGEAAKDAALPAGGFAHPQQPASPLGLDSCVKQAPVAGGPGKDGYAGGSPSHGLTAQQGPAGKQPGQEVNGRMEMPLPSVQPPCQHQAHLPVAAMQQLPHPPRKRTRGSGVSVALNKSIMSASCVGELLALVRARGHNFDFFNISSAVSRAPKLVEAEHASAKSNARAAPHACAAAASASPLPNMSSAEAAAHARAAQNGHGQLAPPAGAGCPTNTPPPPPMGDGAKALAAHLYALSLQHLHTFDARGLANTAWAFAKMRYVPDSVLPAALSIEASTRIDEFAAQNLSNLAWAMVYMHWRDPHLLGLMANRVLLLLDQFKPQELANIMWAFASLEHHDHTTLSALSARAAQLGPRAFKEQEISNIIWALGRAHHHEGPLLDVLLQETLNKLSSFQPQGVSNIVWALGQLNHASPSLLSAIAQRCSKPGALSAFDNQGLCNLAFGTTVLRFRHPSLMAALTEEALLRVATASSAASKPQSTPQTHQHQHPGSHDGGREYGQLPSCLTTVLWAATTLEDWGAASKLLTALAREVNATHPASTLSTGTSTPSSIIHSWEPTSLAQAAWSCARMQAMMAGLGMPQESGPSLQPLGRPEHEGQQQQQLLLSNLAEAVAARVDRFNGQPLALVVSAFCTPEAGQDACSSKLLEKLARRVERAAATLSEQQCEVCGEALQRVQHFPSAPAALDAIQRRAAALASTHSSSCNSSSSSSSCSMHAAYGSASTAVSSPGSSSSSSSSSSNSVHACGTRVQHPWPKVQHGAGAGVHAAAHQLLQQQQQQQQGGARAAWQEWPHAALSGDKWMGDAAGWALPLNEAMGAASGLEVAAFQEALKSSRAPPEEFISEGVGKWGQLVDCAGVQGGVLGGLAGCGGAPHARAAAEEPWASAWPEGLFEDNPTSLLAEAGADRGAGPTSESSCFRRQASTGGMWSAGGLGNGSVPSIAAGQLASPSLAVAGSNSSTSSLANVIAPAAADADVGPVAPHGGLGEAANDEVHSSKLAALMKMMSDGSACAGGQDASCKSQGERGGGSIWRSAPLHTGRSIFWGGLGSWWGEKRAGVRDGGMGRSSGTAADSARAATVFSGDSCSSGGTVTSGAAVANCCAPASLPGLAAAPSAASFAGVGTDQCHSSSIMDSGFLSTPVCANNASTLEQHELQLAPPPYSSAPHMSSPLYSSVPHMDGAVPRMSSSVLHMDSSVPQMSAGCVDSGAGAEVDSIGLLPKGLFDLIDDGHHHQSGGAGSDWAMFAPL